MGIYEDLSKLDTTPPSSPAPKKREGQGDKLTSEVTQKITSIRKTSSESSRDNSREDSRSLPTRDEIQEFSFSLRDELKVKVQAEVPHKWQDELEEIARKLRVKKLELYRFILGEFLGKAHRKKST